MHNKGFFNNIRILKKPFAVNYILPVYDLIDHFPLFSTASPQIDPCGLDILMSKEIGEESEIVKAFQKAFREAVAEGVGIDDVGIDPVEESEFLKLARDAAAGDPVAVAVCEKEAAGPLFSVDPIQRFLLEMLWDIDAAELAAFRVDIDVAASDMFNFKLAEFMDPGTGGSEKVDNEIPVEIPVAFQGV